MKKAESDIERKKSELVKLEQEEKEISGKLPSPWDRCLLTLLNQSIKRSTFQYFNAMLLRLQGASLF